MKPQARVQAAIDVLDILQAQSRVPLDTVTGDYMRRRRYIGSKDRAAIAGYVYDIMRRWVRLGWHIERSGLPLNPRLRMMAYFIFDGANVKRVHDLFDGSKYAPEKLSEEEIKFINVIESEQRERSDPSKNSEHNKVDCRVGTDAPPRNEDLINHPDMPLEVICECPPRYADHLKTYFGEAFADEMRALLKPASLDMRVNVFKCPREKAKAYLSAAGVETDETLYSPWGLRARGKAYLSKTKAFAKGWVEIQDEGSQLIAHICDAQPGMQVLDFCAGAGGKTLALAAAMSCKGRIVAVDTDERRLMKGKDRYKKAGVSDMIEVRPLSEARQAKWLKRQKGKFDIVLCDVPCTGTGTWRRNPDMRWTVYGPSLEELIPIQADILDRACRAVKPGGKLVYATCSLLPQENEQQIEGFLSRNDDFELRPLDSARGLGHPYMRLTPHRHNTDGFFAAILRRKELS
jgi:16S rRNA (cytosine967-C5)-methyltransferase